MKRFFILALCAVLSVSPALAGSMTLVGVGKQGTAVAGYTGPGDVVASAKVWYGLRAYTAAYATALGNIADIVDTATGGASCTIVAKSTGEANLSSLSCVGGTVSVTTFCTVTHAAGCSVSKLYDQTAGGNCSGTCDVVQSSLSLMPLLVLNCLGSLPCMTFTAVSAQRMSSATNMTTNTAPLTISLVAFQTGATTGAIITAAVQYAYFKSNPFFELYAGSSVLDVTITSSTWLAIQGIYDGASTVAYINGTSNTGTVSVATGAGLIILGNDGGANPLNGKLMEAGYWVGGFNGTQQSNMNSNQRTYWGF